ncbi:MAG TPA: cytochrome ubiquinol oxidase subunit I [Casimicrobiaceae bacterium]|nr:cytochrome ubiquinol oxidase subunit I [Casimicrobiaceae bacterium]
MNELDAVFLARIQFAFTISFHIIFPAFTIGLAAYVATLEILWLRTGSDHFARLARFWTKIFAVAFAMGVVSGIMMSYQFGTNWSRFSEIVGNVVAPLIGYEVLTAFFLEATFLGILLFGWHRFPRWLHVTSAVLVALGTSLSAFWILAANSWMHTPAGHEVRDGIAYPVDWLAVIFNPSFPYRFVHMLTACYLTTSLVVLAVGARYLLAGRFADEARTMVRMGLGMVAVLAPLQLVFGDLHGLNTAHHQPQKDAAMEAHWDGSKPAPLVLFAWPDEDAERNRYEVAIPNGASLIITHKVDGLFKGLKDFPRDERPPVWPVFFAFRLMVGLGLAMIALGAAGAWLWRRRTLFDTRWYLKLAGHAWWVGFVALLAGWMVTEIGRQPWLAWGILRTRDAASPVEAEAVALSLVLIAVTYSVVFSVGIWYIRKLLVKGPVPALLEPPKGVPSRPLSAAQRAAADTQTREALP